MNHRYIDSCNQDWKQGQSTPIAAYKIFRGEKNGDPRFVCYQYGSKERRERRLVLSYYYIGTIILSGMGKNDLAFNYRCRSR